MEIQNRRANSKFKVANWLYGCSESFCVNGNGTNLKPTATLSIVC
ncbi:MAG: hypothetical protein H6Q13_2621 [Bacteroidetes bacterium]|nr:hypothetical protein [Bacteroidota bacterium]